MKAVYNAIPKKILLIDDDPDYCNLMENLARRHGIDLEAFPSLDELGSVAKLGNYNFLIFDYDLENFNGFEIAEYVDVFFPNLEVYMVSSYKPETLQRKSWPRCIKKFFSKDEGPFRLLDQLKEKLIPQSIVKNHRFASF